MQRTVDYSPLTAEVTRAEVREFRRGEGAAFSSGSSVQILPIIVGLVVAVVFANGLVFFGSLMGPRLLSSIQNGGGGAIIPLLSLLFVGGIITIVIVTTVRGVITFAGRWERWMRLHRFGVANGLRFSPHDPDPQYPGAIFTAGHSRVALDHLRDEDGRFLDYGNYRYVTGSGKNRSAHAWGFLALHLDRALPHMVLDAKRNNGMFGGTNLPSFFAKEQRLSLEGDFDKHFTLYCPQRYERDALYVFTPDLMALLIDEASAFDVEIVDQWMFVYSAKPFDMRQPAVHQRLLRIVDTVGAKTLTQTDRYADERVGNFAANAIAPQGRRLTRGIPAVAIVLIVILGGHWLISMFGDIFQR